MKHKKIYAWLLIAALFTGLIGVSPALAADVQFTPHPETEYARQFTEKCDGQQWFLDEIERLLNMEQKSLDRVESAAETHFAPNPQGGRETKKIKQMHNKSNICYI